MPPVHIISHDTMLAHDPGPGHPESPARLRTILAGLRDPVHGLPLAWEAATPATDAQVLRVHTPAHLHALRLFHEAGGGMLDADTIMSPASFPAALLACGAAIRAAGAALDGSPAFAAVRPPGHHALAARAMGFCLLNNVVVAARTILEERHVSRVLIIDWDVHHGNGTQALVDTDPRIRYVSLHQWPYYPGTGRADERGVGNIFNVPRPPGLARARYVADLDDAVSRATDGWPPELMLISAGFDAMAGDPLGGFTLEPEDYAALVRRWRASGAPIAAVLEGGYAPSRIRDASVAMVGALSRQPSAVSHQQSAVSHQPSAISDRDPELNDLKADG